MLPPSPLLADLGDGPNVVTVFGTTWGRDRDGLPVKIPATVGVDYRAIVDRQPDARSDANGTILSVRSYRIMILSGTDPGVGPEAVVAWRGLRLVAVAAAAPGTPGTWTFAATGIAADAAQGGTPYAPPA